MARRVVEIPPPPETTLPWIRRGKKYYGFGVSYFSVQKRMEPVLLLLARHYFKMMPAIRNLSGCLRYIYREWGDRIEEFPSDNQLKLWSLGGIHLEGCPWLLLPWRVTAQLLDDGVLPDWAVHKQWPAEFTPVLETEIFRLLEKHGGKAPPGMKLTLDPPHPAEEEVYADMARDLTAALGSAPPEMKPAEKPPAPQPKPTMESAWAAVDGVKDAVVESMSMEEIEAELARLQRGGPQGEDRDRAA